MVMTLGEELLQATVGVRGENEVCLCTEEVAKLAWVPRCDSLIEGQLL